jgi:hypothetical protein
VYLKTEKYSTVRHAYEAIVGDRVPLLGDVVLAIESKSMEAATGTTWKPSERFAKVVA